MLPTTSCRVDSMTNNLLISSNNNKKFENETIMSEKNVSKLSYTKLVSLKYIDRHSSLVILQKHPAKIHYILRTSFYYFL